MQCKEKLVQLMKKIGVPHFKENEIEYLEEFCVIMKPIAMALDQLQGENNCYYGQLLPTLFSLKHRLKTLSEQNLHYFSLMVPKLCNSLVKRFTLFFQLSPEVNEAILATCFHPNFKMRWLPTTTDATEKIKIQNLCANALETLELASNDSSSTTNDDDDDFFVFSSPNNAQQREKSSVRLELNHYLSDKSKSLDSLDNYINIKNLFLRFNTSLCSSAPVERLFSFAGFIQNPRRSAMSDKQFEKLIFLKGNEIM